MTMNSHYYLNLLLAEYTRVAEEVRDEANRIVRLWFGLGVLVTSSIILEQQIWFTWVALAAVYTWFLLLLIFTYQFGRRIRYAIFLEKRINKEVGKQILNFQQFLHGSEWGDKKGYLRTKYIVSIVWSTFAIIPFLIFYGWLTTRALQQSFGIDIKWAILISVVSTVMIIIAFYVVYVVFPLTETRVLNEFLNALYDEGENS